MGSFVFGWTVINIVSERRSSHSKGCNGPNVATLTSSLKRFQCTVLSNVINMSNSFISVVMQSYLLYFNNTSDKHRM